MEKLNRRIKKCREAITSPYRKKDVIIVFCALLTILAIPLTFSIFQVKESIEYAQAQSSLAPRGIVGDEWPDVIVGQPDFSEITPNKVVPNKLFNPHGAIIDRTSSSQRLYVFDAGNSRILGFSWDQCIASTTNPLNCTPSLVIGQPNMNSSACNGDSAFQNHPVRAAASASSLCSLNESSISIQESIMGASMAVDLVGNLYVTDYFNHRVLKYIRPFETDTVADDVWGQSDFTGNQPNKGASSPDSTSLRFDPCCVNAFLAGVDVDATGNVWIADSGNHRVLRFPAGSNTADLVLGQSGFTSRSAGSGLNRLSTPSVVRVNSSGSVYVTDEGNSRVMRFKAPFTNGMNGEIFGSGFSIPHGIDFDPTRPGKVWVANKGAHVLELWDEDTQSRILELGVRGDGNVLGDTTGSIGIDTAGNIIATAPGYDYAVYLKQDIDAGRIRYPSKQFFGTNSNSGNLMGPSDLGAQVTGVVASDNQLIVGGDGRILYWNNPISLTNGKDADGFIGYPGFSINSFSDKVNGWNPVMTADANHRLYAALGKIFAYQMPLTNKAQPLKVIGSSPGGTFTTLPVLGGGTVSLGIIWGIAATDGSEFLWVSDTDNHRVLRIRNPLTNPLVDVVLGQTSITGKQPNQSGSPSATTLGSPGALALDRLGNLFVSDHSLEVQGNFRLLVFNKDLFPTNNTSVLFAVAASKIFPDVATWKPAFDSKNQMVVGYNAYHAGSIGSPNHRFVGIYRDPLGASTAPDGSLKDFYSMAFSATFDENDNLYVADLNRGRVLIYKRPITPQDTESPTVSVTSPSDGGTVSGTVAVAASAIDNTGVTKVEFYVDGVLKAIDTASPYSYSWNTTLDSNKTYGLLIKAYDSGGNFDNSQIYTTVINYSKTLTFTPVDDATIAKSYPNTSYGSSKSLVVDYAPRRNSLLKFQVLGVVGRPITSAYLRLYCTNPGPIGGAFYKAGNWEEETITWNTAPSTGSKVASLGKVSCAKTYSINLTNVVKGDGVLSLAIASTSSDGVVYSSKESGSSFSPKLVINTK
ncbi:MAG: DNRLRE domain-containing protein [Candidatus Woykebacteria bacterium]